MSELVKAEVGLVEPAARSPQAFLATTLQGLVTSQLSSNTRRAYQHDAQQFVDWFTQRGLTLERLTLADMKDYRRYLSDHFAPASAARKLVVARRLLQEAVERECLPRNPAQRLEGIVSEQETPHTALEPLQARNLLDAVDRTTRQGQRDYAMLLLLLKTGMRRSECAALNIGDLHTEQGHSIATIRHAKGNKRRRVKLAVEVRRALDEYLVAVGRTHLTDEAPLFIQFRRGDHPQEKPVSDHLIQRVVEEAAKRAGLNLKLTPHSLRATFVTLALEGGARLQQVQYAVGHADPRTTERYQKRKHNLDDAATDYVHF